MIKTTKVHISTIRGGDTVMLDGMERTVNSRDLTYCSFMGRKLFGDTYRGGALKVEKITYN